MTASSTAVIRKWGNSQGVILPSKLLALADFKVNDPLEIEVHEDEIVLKKAFRHKSFEERVAEYGGKAEAIDFDWGEPVGKEIL